MAQWMRKLDVKDVWKKAEARQITPQELAKVVADRLENLAPFFINGKWSDIELEKQDLVEAFRNFASEEDFTFNDFDHLWREVYDWADQSLDGNWNGKKVCWVATTF
jgi:hypothetical protein